MQAPVDVELQLCYPSPRAREIDRKAVEALAASIKEVGLLSAITVRKVQKSRNGIFCDAFEVIAGMHRVKAFRWLQKTHIPAVIIEADDLHAELMLIDENLRRNDLTPAERGSQEARRKRIWKELHPETKNGAAGKYRPKSQLAQIEQAENLSEINDRPPVDAPAQRYDEASAAASGSSSATVRRHVHRGEALGEDALAKVVRTSLDKGEELDALAKLKKEAPEKCEALIERAASGEKVSAKVEVKKARRAEKETILANKQRALPDKKYGVILADPEWRFEVYSRDTGMDRAADNHYPTSDTETLSRRDVHSIAADDCVLFLWATVPMLLDAVSVMAAWGFEYKSHCIWRKDKIGTGYWFRNKHELLLVGVKGDVPAPAPGTQWESVIEAPVGRHSEKPEAICEMIETYFPSLPKIELNRRGPARPGWSAWGLEVENIKPQEIWRQVPEFDGYEISSLGNIRSDRDRWGVTNTHVINPWIEKNGYAKVTLRRDGQSVKEWLHRIVANAFIGNSDGYIVDHIDGDKTNNSADNLRLCSPLENCLNRSVNIKSTSRYKGVSWDKNRGKWFSCIGFNGKTVAIGRFDDEAEAARAYDAAASANFGEFARLNFPVGNEAQESEVMPNEGSGFSESRPDINPPRLPEGMSAVSGADDSELDIPDRLKRDANNRAPFHQQSGDEKPA